MQIVSAWSSATIDPDLSAFVACRIVYNWELMCVNWRGGTISIAAQKVMLGVFFGNDKTN